MPFNRSLISSAICSLISDVGVTQTETVVDAWADQSGSGNNAVSFIPNSKPNAYTDQGLLNGKVTLKFGGPLRLPLTSSPEYTFFAVVSPFNAKTEGDVFLGSNGIAPGAALAVGSAPVYGAGWAGPARNINLGDSDFIAVGEFKLVTYVKSSTGWSIYCNGDFVRFVADTSVINYSGNHNWTIGRECEAVADYYFQGNMAELLILEEALPNGRRKKVEREILEYWGL